MRQLLAMAAAKREHDGEVIVWQARLVSLAVWVPKEVFKFGLNPLKEPEPESEMMREHKRKLEAMRLATALEDR